MVGYRAGHRRRVARVASIVTTLLLFVSALALLPRSVAVADPATPPVPDPFQVRLSPTGFEPQTIDLVAGQSVVFTNASGATRSIQSEAGIFDSGTIPVGGAFTVAIPDERTVTFVSPGNPTLDGTLRVGPNGFGGPGTDPVANHLPADPPDREDPDSFGQEPRWGLIASRTTILVAFASGATVADANRLLTQIGAKVDGAVGTTGIVVLTIPDRPDHTFADLIAAVDTLQGDPAVKVATMDTLGDKPNTNPVPPAAVTAGTGFSYQPFPLTSTVGYGAYGIEQARFPQAHNLFEAMKRKGAKVDLGIVDTGYDLTHPEFADVAGRGRHVEYLPVCFATVCNANTTLPATQGHGTGALGQMAGLNLGADPLAHVLATSSYVQEIASYPDAGTTILQTLMSVHELLQQKSPSGKAPNLRGST